MAFREHTDFRRQTHACRSLTKHGNVLRVSISASMSLQGSFNSVRKHASSPAIGRNFLRPQMGSFRPPPAGGT